jgi:hypothetical protein
LQEAVARLLRYQVAGEAIGRLDDDGAHAIAGDVIEHGGEAGPLVDGVRALDAVVAVLGDDVVAGPPGERRDSLALALERVLVVADVGH